MDYILFILFFFVLFFLYCIHKRNIENFSPGTSVQLYTSRPYYGWYDFYQSWKFPPWYYFPQVVPMNIYTFGY